MKIVGEIGQEILLSGTIKKIMINEDGMVEYCVNVSGSTFSFWLNAPDIVFKTMGEVVDEDDFRKEYPDRFPDRIVEELRDENATDCDSSATAGDPSGEFEPMPEEYNYDIIPESASGLPVDDEWSRPAPKKRGRPRKATVDDLMKRAKE